MVHLDTTKPYRFYIDACDYGVGAISVQDEAYMEWRIEYWLKKLSGAQLNSSTIGEAYVLTKLKPYLYGADFVVYSDHFVISSDHSPLKALFVGCKEH